MMKNNLSYGLTLLPFLMASSAALAAGPAPEPVTPPANATAVSAPGAIKTNVLVQNWFYNDTGSSATPNFRIRRAEFKFSGNAVENTRWFLQLDAAKALSTAPGGDGKILQDIGAGFTLMPGLELVVGQFKIQTTSESFDPSGELLLPERSVLARAYGDRREMGAVVVYKMDVVKLALMASDGTGTNAEDTNSKKDLSFRAEVDALPDLKLGAFTSASDMSWSTKGRFGANARMTIQELLLRAEYAGDQSSGVKSNALAVDAGYSLNDQWQPVAGLETFRPDAAADLHGAAETVGVNYFLNKHSAKIQAAMTFKKDFASSTSAGGALPATAAGVVSGAKGSLLTLNFQMAI